MKLNILIIFLLFIFNKKSSGQGHIPSNIPATMTHDDWMFSGKVPHGYFEDGYDMSFYNNRIASEGLELNHEKNGIWINYYPDGKVSSIIGYWNGLPEGVWKTYYPNGQLQEEGYHFRKEKPNYRTEAKFDSVTQDSFWIVYSTNNELLKHGTWNKYDSTGRLIESISYNKGKLKNPKTIFNIDLAFWQGCEEHYDEKKCQPLNFQRERVSEDITLVTPCCGNNTEVVLFKSDSDIILKRINITQSECPPEIDISDLPDGNYSVMSSRCPFQKRAKFSIKTRIK